MKKAKNIEFLHIKSYFGVKKFSLVNLFTFYVKLFLYALVSYN